MNEITTDVRSAILNLSTEHFETAVQLRRQIHKHPEIGFTEFKTTDAIIAALESVNEHAKKKFSITRFDKTGLMADLVVTPGEKFIAFRGDIDALPIEEKTDLAFRSEHQGISHSCGHDIHAASVFLAGCILSHLADTSTLKHNVRLVFQPAEEVNPSGAKHIIAQGVLENVQSIYAVHCDPMLDVGQIGTKFGAITSATDLIRITVSGNGGHTSRAHLAGDLIYALSLIASNTPSILRSSYDVREAVTLNWGKIEAGYIDNVIPRKGQLWGTFRTTSATAWKEAKERITKLVEAIAEQCGVSASVEYKVGVPPTINSEEATTRMNNAYEQMFRRGKPIPLQQSLGGEDFSWYLREVDGGMARLGVSLANAEANSDIHQPDFNPNEESIKVAAEFFAGIAVL